MGIRGNNHLRCFTYLCHLVYNCFGHQVHVALAIGGEQSHQHESVKVSVYESHSSQEIPYLDVLLQILWSLESLSTEVALVWLEWDMYADVRGDVITLHGGCAT